MTRQLSSKITRFVGGRRPRLPHVLAIIVLVLFSATNQPIFAQACSCGGAPVLSSLELPASPAGQWQFGLTYEYASQADVVDGSTDLNDDLRNRSTQSGLFEISYGISNRFSTSVLLSLVRQKRRIALANTPIDNLKTSGIGDAVLLLKYNLLQPDIAGLRKLSIGGGVKAPIGKSDLQQSDATLISADMQPGSGAWDGIVWAYAYQGLHKHFPVGIIGTFSYRFTGKHDRFNIGDNNYKFGNELLTSLGMSYSMTNGFDYSLLLRYRSSSADQFNNFDLPNSGGYWLNLVPGINKSLGAGIGIRASGQIPLYRSLEGTQLTTSYTLSFSLSYAPPKTESSLGF